jgi:hypothetical protein
MGLTVNYLIGNYTVIVKINVYYFIHLGLELGDFSYFNLLNIHILK